jgi:hypothetical protein
MENRLDDVAQCFSDRHLDHEKTPENVKATYQNSGLTVKNE